MKLRLCFLALAAVTAGCSGSVDRAYVVAANETMMIVIDSVSREKSVSSGNVIFVFARPQLLDESNPGDGYVARMIRKTDVDCRAGTSGTRETWIRLTDGREITAKDKPVMEPSAPGTHAAKIARIICDPKAKRGKATADQMAKVYLEKVGAAS